MATSQQEVQTYLELARGFAARVADSADRMDADRQFPSELSEDMADKGFFRLLLPRSLGGAELDHPYFLEILRVFAAVDASAAWCLNQNNVFTTASVRIPKETAQEVWGERRAVVSNGPPSASAIAVPVEGGYRLTGQWAFSTGYDHATWVAALTPVGQRAQGNGSGSVTEHRRIMLIPKDQVRLVDRWQVQGLRGTGSFGFEVNDLFVPYLRSYDQDDPPWETGPLYVIPRTLLFSTGFATSALAVARAALATATEFVSRNTPQRTVTGLPNLPTTQRTLGEAEATWRSARAYLDESATAAWESACKNLELSMEERIQLRLASTYAIRSAGQTVDLAYQLCGSSAIFDANPIQRKFQDIHVITQHAQGRLTHYETAGQFLLGMSPEGNY